MFSDNGPIRNVFERTLATPRTRPNARPWVMPTDAELLSELRTLRLAANPFTWALYRRRLEEHISAEVRILSNTRVDDPLLEAQMNLHRIDGGLIWESSGSRVWAVVPEKASMKAWIELVFHELSHVAAGHPVPPSRVLAPTRAAEVQVDDDGYWSPPRKLARQQPTKDEGTCELEAKRRARFLSKTSVMGRALYLSDARFLGLTPR